MPRVIEFLCACAVVVFPSLLLAADAAPPPPPTQTGTPRRVLAADYQKKVLLVLSADDKVEFEHPIRNIHDAQVLPNGNILFQTDWPKLVEMTPDRKVVWEYDAAKANGNEGKKVEVHAFQRLPDGATMIAESGPSRIIEVDKDGKLLKEVKLKVAKSDPHRDTRLARKLDNGNYLVAHEGERSVREYDPTGKVVWEFLVGTAVYSAYRLPNGNTLIGTGNGHSVLEIGPDGTEAWSIKENDLPNVRLVWVTNVRRLENGNTLITNCHAGPQNPQMIEVTPDKKVVWTFKDFKRLGNSMPVGLVLE